MTLKMPHKDIGENAIGLMEGVWLIFFILATIGHACGLKSCINLRHLRELDLDHNRKFGDPRKLNTEGGN